MSINFFNGLKDAFNNLNPDEVRQQVDRPVRIALHAKSELAFEQMEMFLAPPVQKHPVAATGPLLQRVGYSTTLPATRFDIEIYSDELAHPKGAFRFEAAEPERMVRSVIEEHPGLSIALARRIAAFRAPASAQVIRKIAKENALFSLATAIPDVIPLVSLPWAMGEFASDTAFITANQVRMAFLLAAASNRDIGYREQKGEVVSILLSAFGWRALARELVGHIPFGGGLIPKAAIAYAGTRVAGMSLERYYREGKGFSSQEQRIAYERALEKGKAIAQSMLNTLKRPQQKVSG